MVPKVFEPLKFDFIHIYTVFYKVDSVISNPDISEEPLILKNIVWTHFFSFSLTLLHTERPKLYAILAFLSAIGLRLDQTTGILTQIV